MMRKVWFRSDKELEGMRYVASIFDFGLSLTITVAFNEMLNAYLLLRDTPQFRHELKRYANQADDMARLKQAGILSLMKDKAFYDVYSDKVIDLVGDDITRVRIAIKQVLDDAAVGQADMISQCETARIMLGLARHQFVETIKLARERYGYDYSEMFRAFDISGVFGAWDKAVTIVLNNRDLSGINANLNTPKIQTLFDAMARKFADGVYVQGCLQEALKANKDFENDIIVRE